MANKKPVVIVSGRPANIPAGDALDLTGADTYILLDEHASAPATPGTGTIALYGKTDGLLYSKDDTGAETGLGGGGGTPGGADTQIQYNDGGSFGGDANFTYDDTTGQFRVNFDGTNTKTTSTLAPCSLFAADATAVSDIAGSNIDIVAGNGDTDGGGGTISIVGGDSGGSAGADQGGSILITGGEGAGSTLGGGDINITGGTASAAVGGTVSITGGEPTGAVFITGGFGPGVSQDGGNVVIAAGDADNTGGNGGTVTITGGNALDGAVDAGPVVIEGGSSAASATAGGYIEITGGACNAENGSGNYVQIFGGPGNGTGNGGEITIAGGLGGGSGEAGSVAIGSNNTGTSRTGNMLFLPTSAGIPTGTPTTPSGLQAFMLNTTDNSLFVYDTTNTEWVQVGGAGGGPQPQNQIVYGTGSGVTSKEDYQFIDTKNIVQLRCAQDYLTRQYVLKAATTDDTQTEMLMVDNYRMTLLDDSTWRFEIHIVARRTDAGNESAAYEIKGCIDRNSGTTAIVGTVSINVTAEDTSAWDVAVDADNTNDALRIQVTGETSKTIRWVAFVRTVEVTG